MFVFLCISLCANIALNSHHQTIPTSRRDFQRILLPKHIFFSQQFFFINLRKNYTNQGQNGKRHPNKSILYTNAGRLTSLGTPILNSYKLDSFLFVLYPTFFKLTKIKLKLTLLTIRISTCNRRFTSFRSQNWNNASSFVYIYIYIHTPSVL